MRASVHDAEDLMTLEAVDNLGQQVPFPTDGLRRVGREGSVSGTISHAESRWKVISVSQSRLRGARSRTAVSRGASARPPGWERVTPAGLSFVDAARAYGGLAAMKFDKQIATRSCTFVVIPRARWSPRQGGFVGSTLGIGAWCSASSPMAAKTFSVRRHSR